MKELTIEQLQEQLDDIFDAYEKGDDTLYRIKVEEDKFVILSPFDGPYEETVKEDKDGNYFVEIPNRLLAKKGWDENTELEMEIENGSIILREKTLENK